MIQRRRIGMMISIGLGMAIAACAAPPQPLPLAQSPTVTPAATPTSPEAIAWSSILGTTSAPDGWQVVPCDTPVFLCITSNGDPVGYAELFTSSVEGSDFETRLTDAGFSPSATNETNSAAIATALRAQVDQFYATIQADRQSQIDANQIQLSFAEPEVVPVGQRQGVRYELTTTKPDGTLLERTVGYMGTDGRILYTISASTPMTDAGGAFHTDAELQRFEPHLAEIVANLQI